MGSIKQFWNLARKLPLSAAFLAFSTVAFSTASYLAGRRLAEYLDPPNFNNLSGDYSGTMPGAGAFHLCFAAFGPRVLGEMTLDGGATHFDYWGYIDKGRNQLTLHYTGGGGPTSVDRGEAFLSQTGNNDLQGYYQSSVNPGNRQTLVLERTPQHCDLNHFDHGW